MAGSVDDNNSMDANVGFREKEQSLPGLVPPDSVILLVVSTLLTRLADSWVKLFLRETVGLN
jgi:hypothetical protein